MDANRMSGTLLGIAWVALAAAPLAGQTQAADAKPGVVEGAVINQLTGEPLRRAEVRLVPARAVHPASRLRRRIRLEVSLRPPPIACTSP